MVRDGTGQVRSRVQGTVLFSQYLICTLILSYSTGTVVCCRILVRCGVARYIYCTSSQSLYVNYKNRTVLYRYVATVCCIVVAFFSTVRYIYCTSSQPFICKLQLTYRIVLVCCDSMLYCCRSF